MKIKWCLAVILLVLTMLSCIRPATNTMACTQEARAGLNIVVKDSRNSLYLRDSVKVIAAGGSYTEALENFPGNPPTFMGAWEREGSYVLTITHPRFQTFISPPIEVSKDACHVIAQSQTIALIAK